MRYRLLSLLLVVALAGCRLPSLVPQVTGSQPHGPTGLALNPAGLKLEGRVRTSMRVANLEEPNTPISEVSDELFNEIVNGATIALIDADTSLTLATSLVKPNGEYVINFEDRTTLVDGRTYYLDLYKGIRVEPLNPNSPFNQAGADVLRLRNILIYQAATADAPAGWKSLDNAEPSREINIGNRSTAMSAAIALMRQAGNTIDYPQFMGALQANIENDESWSLGGMTHRSFMSAKSVVYESINKHRDPLQYIVYDAANNLFLSSYIGFSVASVEPTEGRIGQEITIRGSGFGSEGDPMPTVTVNSVPAQVLSRSNQTIVAVVAPGTRTGPVAVTLESKTQAGPSFRVIFNDGHSAYIERTIAGKQVLMLYAANPDWNTVVEISPDGEIATRWSDATVADLLAPQQVVARNGKLYVACNPSNTNKDMVLELDPETGTSRRYTTVVPHPVALAFDPDGILYVASDSGSIYRINSAGAEVAPRITFNDPTDPTKTTFSGPRGLAFDFEGNLYVSEKTGNRVYKVGHDGVATRWANVPAPMGLAVNSAGDLFIASNTANVIYRVTRFRAISPYLMVNSPGGLTLDERGNLYVSDTAQNLIYSLNQTGGQKIYAYGISNPRGLAVDPNRGTIYVSLNKSNAILKVENGVLKPFVTGIANPMTINFRANGLLIAHPETDTISFAGVDGTLETKATGVILPGGADQDDTGGQLTGPLYAARFGDLDNSETSRPPRFDSWEIGKGEHVGIEAISGTRTVIRHLFRQMLSTYLAVDSQENLFYVHPADKTLTRIHPVPGGGNNSRLITRMHTFDKTPGFVAVDANDNVYVAVADENAVYRFKKAVDGYAAPSKIEGFNKPWGITFSDTDVPRMFVSNTGDGKLRYVDDPANATMASELGVTVPTTVKGIDYMGTATKGTGTLYMANNRYVEKLTIVGNAANGNYSTYASNLPDSNWNYLYAHKSSGDVYGYTGPYYGMYRLVKYPDLPDPVPVYYVRHVGWGERMGAVAFSADRSRFYRVDVRFKTYIEETSNLSDIATIPNPATTREIELRGNHLYVASPDGTSGGGVLRISLDKDEQLYIPIRSYSLGTRVGPDNKTYLYVGGQDKGIYEVDELGKHTKIWTVDNIPYGLDVVGNTVWIVDGNNLLYEQVIGNATVNRRKYGLKGPVF